MDDGRLIVVVVPRGQQPGRAAAQAARGRGTRLAASLRWHGLTGPAYLEAPTADGRTVRVTEPVACRQGIGGILGGLQNEVCH